MTRPGRAHNGAVSTRPLAALLLAVATFAAFAPVLSAGFVIYDDERYVLRNPRVQEGFSSDAVRWAFSSGHASNWHPLTWISHMLDWSLFGASPAGHHFTSLLLHAANAVLLFLLLERMTGVAGRSAFAAALFALHPLRVESVAWVAERKDVLSTLLWILATWSYVRWTRAGGMPRFLLVLSLFALGLMAKPMLVTLPLTLLVLDYWPLGRWPESIGRAADWRFLFEKIPLLALSVASAVVTVAVQAAGPAVGSIREFPLGIRIANALLSCVGYLRKTVWPAGLAVFYPHPGSSLPLSKAVAAALLLALVTGCAVWLRRSRPYLLAGWLWYLVTLLPVIGLVQVGEQGMADRYTYVPLIGIFIAAAWGIPDAVGALALLAGRGRDESALAGRIVRFALPASAVAILLALALATYAQAATWKSSATLFEHALAVTRGNYLAHIELGTVLSREGRTEEALAHYAEAARIRPDDPQVLYNTAVALATLGRDAEAKDQYARALALDPGFGMAHNNLGILLAKEGNLDEAIRHFSEAVRLTPALAEAHVNLAVALHAVGRDAEAQAEVEIAIRLGFAPPEDLLRRLTGKRVEGSAPR